MFALGFGLHWVLGLAVWGWGLLGVWGLRTGVLGCWGLRFALGFGAAVWGLGLRLGFGALLGFWVCGSGFYAWVCGSRLGRGLRFRAFARACEVALAAPCVAVGIPFCGARLLAT